MKTKKLIFCIIEFTVSCILKLLTAFACGLLMIAIVCGVVYFLSGTVMWIGEGEIPGYLDGKFHWEFFGFYLVGILILLFAIFYKFEQFRKQYYKE